MDGVEPRKGGAGHVLAAAKVLNFTKAAADCSVSQPALTKAVKMLESELGAPLFHREGKRVLLSEFGRSLLPHLQQIMRKAEATRTPPPPPTR